METKNLELEKISGADYVSPEPLNRNADKLDALGDCYVVSHGSSGGWDWRRWSDGTQECCGCFSDSRQPYNDDVNGFFGFYSGDYPYPVEFSEPPALSFSAKIGSGFAINGGDVSRSASFARCYALSTAGGQQECVWEVQARGRWR